MNEVEDALCDQLSGLGRGPTAVALEGKEHGLTPLQTMRLVLRVCGATFNEAKEATTQAHYGISMEEHAAPLIAAARIAAATPDDDTDCNG